MIAVLWLLREPSALPQGPTSSGAEAWWVWVVAAAGAVLLFLLAMHLRTRRLKADRLRLEDTVAALRAEVAELDRRLEEASFTDPVTGLRNRRFFSASIDGEVLRVLRAYAAAPAGEGPAKRDLIFYLIDLDNFKAVNDLYGNDAGDSVLAETATRLHSIARQSDLVVRWGGEEFLVVSRDGQRRDAEVLAHRILDVIGKQSYDAGGGREARMTCSIGWAAFPWLTDDARARSYEEVLTTADRARQLAKETGKNRAIGAQPAEADAAAQELGTVRFHTTITVGPEA